jgi:hypothetical protein
VLVKIWNVNTQSVSRMYIDGGAVNGGKSIEVTTPAGNASFQDPDGAIQYLGFVQTGGGADVQFIGQIDEVAIYAKPFIEANARIHFLAAGGAPTTAPRFNPPTLSAGVVTITWTGSGTLQRANDLAGTWSDVTPSPTGNSYSEPATSATRSYFRLRP